jgi:hypothetical protein
MIDDEHTLHSRGHPDGSLKTDHYVVSALICANLCKSALFLKWLAYFLIRRPLNRALRRSSAAAPKTVNQPNQNRKSTEIEPNTLSAIYAYERLVAPMNGFRRFFSARARELHDCALRASVPPWFTLTFAGQRLPGLNRSVAGVPPDL